MMKNLLMCFALAFFSMGCEEVCAQAVDLNNPKNYGIWQWLSPPVSSVTYPEIRGRMFAARWADIEPSPNDWDWVDFDNEIKSRVADSLPFIFKVYTKEDAPMWLYSNGVPKVVERNNNDEETGWAPYYQDSDYKFYFKRMITAVRQHIETYAPNIRNYIIGVQGCYGSTGDYISYKGEVDPQYDITTSEFVDLFKEFSLYYYNEYINTNPRIYLVVNPSYSSQGNFEWVEENMPDTWFKCSNMGKGYQLNGERSKSKWLYPILNDPQEDGSYTRARSEITSDGLLTDWWTKIPYQNMLSIMCYGIQWGLDWSNQGPTQFIDPLNDSAYSFFNKYAGQKNPLTATNAMCYLKDVIDASDSDRFPVSLYGPVEQTAARFNSVLKPFIPYGAKLEDVSNAVLTEYENIHSRGINDVGWDLFPGNYERYIHQINANVTSTGYWNVASADPNSMYGRFARGFEIEKNKTGLYFDVNNGFLGNMPLDGGYPITLDITYLDDGNGSWQLYYDSKSSEDKLAYTVNCDNTNRWVKKTITISDAYFGNKASGGSDFYILSADGNTKNILFSMVELSRSVSANSLAGLYSSATANFDTLCINSVSEPEALTISGTLLTAPVGTLGPLEGFSFSLTKDGVYTDSLVRTNLNSSFSTTVYVKFSPKRPGSYDGEIPLNIGDGVISGIIPVKAYAVSGPDLSANITNISCNGKRDGAIDLELTGGVAPFAYQWSSSAKSYFKPATEDISGLEVADYTVVVNSFKCSVSKTFSITEPDVLVTSVSQDSAITCKGGSTTIQVTATGGTKPYTDAGTFTVTSGFKIYTVTDARGCTDAQGYTVVNGGITTPSTPRINGPSSVSANESGIEYTVSNSNDSYNYSWTVPDDAVIINGQNTSAITVNWGTIAGNVTVKANNECGTSAITSKAVAVRNDFTQETTSSSIVATTETSKSINRQMTVMPNPVIDIATLQFYADAGFAYSIQITDITGKIILAKKGTASLGTNIERLDAQKFVTGLYFLTLTNDRGERQSTKLMKQ